MGFFDAEVSAAADECIVIVVVLPCITERRSVGMLLIASATLHARTNIFQLLTVTVCVAPRIAGRNSRSDTA
jgi:hypothetical protein